MERRFARLAPLLLALAASGCAGLRSFEHTLTAAGVARFDTPSESQAVSITHAGRGGRGAVVGRDRVLTVAHLVQGPGPVWIATAPGGGLVRGRIVRWIPARPEPYVELLLETESGPLAALTGFQGFSEARWLDLGAGDPVGALTAHGYRRWAVGVLRPGDSGSPVLDSRGDLVGLVSGRTPGGRPVEVRLPAPSAQPVTP